MQGARHPLPPSADVSPPKVLAALEPEPLQMASAVDGVIVVARAGETSRTALSSVITTLARLRASLVGVVLNEVHREISPGYYYSYYNRYNKYYAERGDNHSGA